MSFYLEIMTSIVYNHGMDSIVITTVAKKFDRGYLLVPATIADKRTLDMLSKTAGTRTVKMTAAINKPKKSYEQVKSVFALIDIIFQIDHQRKPTEHERALYYSYLLNQYGERELVSVSGSEPSLQVISLSSMSKAQASRFISSLIAHIAERCEIPEYLTVEVSSVIESFLAYKGTLDIDCTDTDSNGDYLTTEKWCEKNNYSHATGKTENLEIAHIVSKGTAPQFRDCVWNFLRLTHDEHMEQHKQGWDYMFKMYPHLKGRVERARHLAGKLDIYAPNQLADEIMEDIF